MRKDNPIPRVSLAKKLKFFVPKLPILFVFYVRALWWYVYIRPVEEEMNKLKLKEVKEPTHDKT